MLIVTIGLSAGFAQTAATATDGWVVLPVSEYTALKSAAFSGRTRSLTAPPVEATLSRIDYNLKVDGDLATGEARLDCRCHQEWLGASGDARWFDRARRATRRPSGQSRDEDERQRAGPRGSVVVEDRTFGVDDEDRRRRYNQLPAQTFCIFRSAIPPSHMQRSSWLDRASTCASPADCCSNIQRLRMEAAGLRTAKAASHSRLLGAGELTMSVRINRFDCEVRSRS